MLSFAFLECLLSSSTTERGCSSRWSYARHSSTTGTEVRNICPRQVQPLIWGIQVNVGTWNAIGIELGNHTARGISRWGNALLFQRRATKVSGGTGWNDAQDDPQGPEFCSWAKAPKGSIQTRIDHLGIGSCSPTSANADELTPCPPGEDGATQPVRSWTLHDGSGKRFLPSSLPHGFSRSQFQ
jgi:hypothetical protein